MTPDKHSDLDELIQYCMGASDAVLDSVRLHLRECVECRAQVERLYADMALVAMTAPPVRPPSAAKERLFQAAGLNLAQAEKAALGTPVSAVDSKSPASPTSQASPTSPAQPSVIPLRPRRSSPGLIWGGWIAAAACLLYAVKVHDTNRAMQSQLRAATAEIVQSAGSADRAEKVLDVLSSPRAQRVTLVAAHTAPEPTGHAVYLASRGALVFTAGNLKPLPPQKTYELWVIPANGSAPVPAGTFQPDARGMASVLLPNLPPGVPAKAFGVTMENAGGSATPTMPILLAGS
ncbi:MAG TPA: anti-sigma factor [Acidobacteriaceae bacterium]|nr:anti-sigma factor [Acidobacteriaceae bacterium]